MKRTYVVLIGVVVTSLALLLVFVNDMLKPMHFGDKSDPVWPTELMLAIGISGATAFLIQYKSPLGTRFGTMLYILLWTAVVCIAFIAAMMLSFKAKGLAICACSTSVSNL